jgi:hypothetical protein
MHYGINFLEKGLKYDAQFLVLVQEVSEFYFKKISLVASIRVLIQRSVQN